MQRETDRLMSFFNPKFGNGDNSGLVVQLASAGFYRSIKNFSYNQPLDLVKCFYCMMEKGYWKNTDNVLEVHMRLSPECKWGKYNIKPDSDNCLSATSVECESIRNKQSLIYNRCVHVGLLNTPHPYPKYFLNHVRASGMATYGADVPRKDYPQLVPLILSEGSIDTDDMIRVFNWRVRESGIFAKVFDMVVRQKIWWAVDKTYVKANGFIASPDKAVCIKSGEEGMCIAHNRMESFKNASSPYLKKNAESLAMAGFYRHNLYTNTDRCRCFFCGLYAESWEENDDPYHEHAKLSNGCGYIRTKMNTVQIKSILYHFHKVHVMGEITQNYRRYVLATMLDYKPNSHSDTVARLDTLDILENRSDLLELMGRFTITEIVNGCLYMTANNESSRLETMYNTTRDHLETILVMRNRVNTVCECQKSRSTIGFDDRPQESGTKVKLPSVFSEHVPPTVSQFLSEPIPEPEPPKIVPYSQLPSTTRANMFANEEYKNYTREQAIEKLEKLLLSYTCTVCMAAPCCMVFLPCRHMVTCENCNMGNPNANCPICRSKIIRQVKANLCETQMAGCDS